MPFPLNMGLLTVTMRKVSDRVKSELFAASDSGGSRGGGAIRPWPPSKLAMEFGPPLEEEGITRVA